MINNIWNGQEIKATGKQMLLYDMEFIGFCVCLKKSIFNFSISN